MWFIPILLIAGVAYLMTQNKSSTSTATNTSSATPTASAAPQKAVLCTSKADFVGRMETALANVDYSSLSGDSDNNTQNALIAVAAFESAWGGFTSQGVYTKTNNLFSITVGSSWTGPSYNGFRSYSTWEDSLTDFIRLMGTSYYSAARTFLLSGDGSGFFSEIKALGYDATDPQYAADLTATLADVGTYT